MYAVPYRNGGTTTGRCAYLRCRVSNWVAADRVFFVFTGAKKMYVLDPAIALTFFYDLANLDEYIAGLVSSKGVSLMCM